MKVREMLDQKLIKQTIDYFNYLNDCKVKQIPGTQIVRYSDRCDIAVTAFQDAYNAKGLAGVDDLLESINQELHKANSTLGFREGCGLETQEGRPPYLIILLVNFSSDRVIAQDAIRL